MADPTRRTPDTRGNRTGDAAPSLGPADASTGPAGRPGTGPPASPAAADEVPTLATPTLAALYASQGHREMAAAIYARLGQGQHGLPPDRGPGSRGAAGQAAGATVERLLALGRAARRRRVQTRGAALPPPAEDCADGR